MASVVPFCARRKRTAWHTRRRISSRKVQCLKRNYFGLVSTLFIDDEILFCANEQSETSKRFPPGSLLFLGLLPLPLSSPRARTLFPLFYVVTTFGQRTLTKVDEKGGDSGRRRTGEAVEEKAGRAKTKIK